MLFSKWNNLSLSTRVQIATAFGVSKIGPTHVFNNTIQSDGFKFQDIERAITIEKMQEYLNTNQANFDTLWDMLVTKTEGRLEEITVDSKVGTLVTIKPPTIVVVSKAQMKAAKEIFSPKKRGRPAKKTTGK